MPPLIRPATQADAAAIAGIYNHYVRNTVVTFEEQEVSADEIASRVAGIVGASLPFLLSVQDGQVRGYAYAGRWNTRSAYRFAVETTIYLDAAHVGRGIGRGLYRALLDELKALGLHTAIGGIALPNPGSVALHEKLGFVKTAHYKEVGFKFGKWIDVAYWQRML